MTSQPIKTIKTGLPPRPGRPSPGVRRGQHRQQRGGVNQVDPIGILKDLKGILKVKVVKKRAIASQLSTDQLSQSSFSGNLNNLIDPRLNCSFSNYDKDIKCNSSDSPRLSEQDNIYNCSTKPFCEEHFEVPIRGDLSEFLTIKLQDRNNEVGELRLKMSEILQGGETETKQLNGVFKFQEQQDLATQLNKSQTKWYPLFSNNVKQGELMVYTQFIPDPTWQASQQQRGGKSRSRSRLKGLLCCC